MSAQPLVYIIVLSFNGKRWLGNCLETVLMTDYSNYRVLVVDNASKDGSADYVAKYFPNCELIRNRKNFNKSSKHKIIGDRHVHLEIQGNV